MKIMMITFGGIGLILLTIAGLFFIKEQIFLSSAIEATGKVADFRTMEDDDGSLVYCPIIDFSTQDSRNGSFEGTCASPAPYKLGDPVKVIYDPQDPDKAQVQSILDEYLIPGILSLVGLPFFCFGLWSFFMNLRKA